MWVQPFNHVVIGMEPGESENLKLWWISSFWHLSNLEDAALLMSFDPIFFEVLVAIKLRCPARQACQHIGWKLRIHAWDPRVELGDQSLPGQRIKGERGAARASEDLGEEWHSGAESIADSADMADETQLPNWWPAFEALLCPSWDGTSNITRSQKRGVATSVKQWGLPHTSRVWFHQQQIV